MVTESIRGKSLIRGTNHLTPPAPYPRQAPTLGRLIYPEPNTCLSWASHYALEEISKYKISERKLCDEIVFLARLPSYTTLCLTSPSPAHLNCFRPARKSTRTFFFRDGWLENRAAVSVNTP